MEIREPRHGDKERIEEILSQHNFEFPSGPIIVHAICEDDGEIVAYGVVRLIAEEVMIMDKNLSNKSKSKVLELLHQRAIQGSTEAGFDQLHAFVQDEHFIEVLKKHYGYKDCKGKAIVMLL